LRGGVKLVVPLTTAEIRGSEVLSMRLQACGSS
jgi:hypothetical protein